MKNIKSLSTVKYCKVEGSGGKNRAGFHLKCFDSSVDNIADFGIDEKTFLFFET